MLLYEHIDDLFPEENTSRKHCPEKQASPLFYFCPQEEVLFSCRVKVEAEAKSGRVGPGKFFCLRPNFQTARTQKPLPCAIKPTEILSTKVTRNCALYYSRTIGQRQ